MKEPAVTTRDIARELARKYSTMTHDELDILESVLVPRKYVKGTIILKEGEQCQSIIYIHRGLLRQFYFKNGKEVTEYLAVDGDIVMCIESLFKEEPSYLQVEALENTILYELPKQRLEQVALHNVNCIVRYWRSRSSYHRCMPTCCASRQQKTAIAA